MLFNKWICTGLLGGFVLSPIHRVVEKLFEFTKISSDFSEMNQVPSIRLEQRLNISDLKCLQDAFTVSALRYFILVLGATWEITE